MALDPAELESRRDWLATQSFDLILHGAHLAENAGAREIDAAYATLPALCSRREQPVVIVLAEGGNEAAAVQALRRGAFDYLPRRGLGAAALAAALQAGLAEHARREAHAAEARMHAIDADADDVGDGESSDAAVAFAGMGGADVSEATWEAMLGEAQDAITKAPRQPYMVFHEGARL